MLFDGMFGSNRIGFPKSRFDEEKRLALLPTDVSKLPHPEYLFFQTGYGSPEGIPDSEYRGAGANIAASRFMGELEIICQPKFCEGDIPFLKKGQVVFGWVHLEGEEAMQRRLKQKKITAIAWEYMFKDCEKVFDENSRITGRIGVIHALAYAGRLPEECETAVIGRGTVGAAAAGELKKQGVKRLDIYHTENIADLNGRLGKYDMIVHCAASDNTILSERDLKFMKFGALLVHLGSDSIKGNFNANSIYNPVTSINNGNNLVYCVNHVPTLAHFSSSRAISRDVLPYINALTTKKPCSTILDAIVMDEGVLAGRLTS